MMYSVKLLPIANEDILAIDVALGEHPRMAARIFAEMDRKLKLLKDMPHMWPYYDARKTYREMQLEGHLLFYIVDDKRREVLVYRVLWGRMDVASQLRIENGVN